MKSKLHESSLKHGLVFYQIFILGEGLLMFLWLVYCYRVFGVNAFPSHLYDQGYVY